MTDRPALQAALANAEALVLSLRAALVEATPTDELLTAAESLEQYGIGHDGLLAAERRGEIELTRGPRNKLLASRAALEAYVRRPHTATKPRPRRKPAEVVSLADWDTQAERELKALAGGRR